MKNTIIAALALWMVIGDFSSSRKYEVCYGILWTEEVRIDGIKKEHLTIDEAFELENKLNHVPDDRIYWVQLESDECDRRFQVFKMDQ